MRTPPQQGSLLAAASILVLLAAVTFLASPGPEDLANRGPASLLVDPAALPSPGRVKVLGTRPAALGRLPDGRLFALSLRCSYLGCRLLWDEATQQFRCPCHGDLYSADGSVLAGKASTHLDRFMLRETSGGRVEVLFSKVFVMVGREQPPGVQYPRSQIELHM